MEIEKSLQTSHYTILYYTILYYTILYYTILYYTILYYTILYYTILYYTILYYTILYYTILSPGSAIPNQLRQPGGKLFQGTGNEARKEMPSSHGGGGWGGHDCHPKGSIGGRVTQTVSGLKLYVHICMYVHVYVHIHIYIYKLNIYIYIYIYIFYMYVHKHVYIFMGVLRIHAARGSYSSCLGKILESKILPVWVHIGNDRRHLCS